MPKSDKQLRLEHANQLSQVISTYGRQFFFNKKQNRTAKLILDINGRVWFMDDYSGELVYTHNTGFMNKWKGFTHGGTLKNLIQKMRDYIIKGKQIPITYIGQKGVFNNDNIWGYDDDEMEKTINESLKLPIIKQ